MAAVTPDVISGSGEPLVRHRTGGQSMPRTSPEPPRADTILRTSSVLHERYLHGEPSLEELLAEPIVVLAASRDGLSIAALRAQCLQVRSRLGGADRATEKPSGASVPLDVAPPRGVGPAPHARGPR
jgi:hypothetical protein